MPRILTLLLILTASLRAAQVPAPDPLRAAAFDHFYNLEFDEALAIFEQMEKTHSEEPEIHNHVAQTLLYREMFRDGALESELVSGNNAFLRRAKLNASPDVQKHFDGEISRAMALARSALAKNPNDPDALYALGVSYGLRSNYNFLVRKAWHDALSDATQARKLHAQVTELQPDNYDARLVQGVDDYLVGSLSWGWRTLGVLAGFHGDKEGGIRTIETVAKKGIKNKGDAEIILCALYRRENRPRAALPLLDDLTKRYPRNWLLLFERAHMYSALGNKKEALDALDRLAELKQQNSPGFARVSWEKIYFEKGNIQFWYKDFDQALVNLKKVTASPKELDLNTGVLAYMRQGQIYDLTNRRSLAKQAYEQAISFAPEAEAAKESQRYMHEPYQRDKS